MSGNNPASTRQPAVPNAAAPPPGTMLPPLGLYPIPACPNGGQPIYYYPPYFPPPPYTAPPAGPPGPNLGTALAVDPASGQIYQYISGFNNSSRLPQPAPPIDPDFPAANLVNSTGGAGAEPGYSYFFPSEHAKVVVLKCPVPPWTLVPGAYAEIPFYASLVPAEIRMNQLLAGFGAQNPDKKQNQFWEVYPQGGGKWGWKEHVTGDDEVMMARTVRDMGWLNKREGVAPTVYLWISKGEY